MRLEGELFKHFHQKWDHRCDNSDGNYRNPSIYRYCRNQLVCHIYQDSGYHEWKKSERDQSERESDDPKNGTKNEIYECEDDSKDESTYIPILKSDARNICWISYKKYRTSTDQEWYNIVHNVQVKI